MSSSTIQSILAAKRTGGREDFHRRLFEAMLLGQQIHEPQPMASADRQLMLELISRWIVEAPAGDDFGLLRMLAVRSTLRALVVTSGASYGQFLSKALGLNEHQLRAPGSLPAWKQAKLAALGDASLLSAAALQAWHGASPVYARLAAIACLDLCPSQAELAQATAEVGRWLASMEPVAMPGFVLEHLKVSAFHVSYLADSGRHDFKRALVRQAAHILQGAVRSPAPEPAAPGAADAPVRLTIVGELLFPQHAMFRCYAEVLAGLKESFHVSLLADEPTRCEQHGLISHEQVYFQPGERDVGRLAGLVTATRPDIVLYPSIGMSYWTFALSLLRLAPLQLMSVGHPAPSCSDQIDGTLVYKEMIQPSMPGFGRVLGYDMQPLPVPPPGGWSGAARASGEAPVVSINAAAMKLSPAFLAAVKEVLEDAPANTTLQFFPNVVGPAYLVACQELGDIFPQAIVHPATGYAAYMEALSRSDLVLQSFPFGGTNTVMDALALGIPMVCMEADDLAGAADPLILRHAGLGQLCAANEAHYVALARGLLASQQERLRIRELAATALGRLEVLQAPGAHSMADAIKQAWSERSPR